MGSLSFLGSVGVSARGFAAAQNVPGLRRISLEPPALPASWDGLRILQVSDVHAGPYMPVERMRRIRDLVSQIPADVIVFTGDQLDRRRSDARLFAAGFAGLKAPLGVYGILGNHDHSVEPELSVWALRKAGITPLVNEVVRFERGGVPLALAGVEDIQAKNGRQPRFEILKEHHDAFRICLCHQPQGWHRAAENGAHVTIAGHTHGGQIALTTRNLNPARFHTRYVAGPYRRDDAFLYVSRGIGVGAVPLRVGSPPEIDLITLRSPAVSERRVA
jgi:predicted MPP superfamily phosphohydrolase